VTTTGNVFNKIMLSIMFSNVITGSVFSTIVGGNMLSVVYLHGIFSVHHMYTKHFGIRGLYFELQEE
jgi:hypothetical protein